MRGVDTTSRAAVVVDVAKGRGLRVGGRHLA